MAVVVTTFLRERNAIFQLEVGANKDAILFPISAHKLPISILASGIERVPCGPGLGFVRISSTS